MYVKCITKDKRKVAKAMHEEARREGKDIEEMREERMRHIHLTAKTKPMCRSNAAVSPCMSSQEGQSKMRLVVLLKLWKEYWEKLLNEQNL